MEKLAIVVMVLLALSACAAPTKTDSSQATQKTATLSPVSQTTTSNTQSGTLSQADIESRKLANQLQDLQKKSVYFDLDKHAVEPVYRDVIGQQADFMKAHGNEILTLQGNADERGSDEYNLALGEKRASEVRKNLELLGVPGKQIKIVSFGEEKPRLTCPEESCWKENRRVDFVYGD